MTKNSIRQNLGKAILKLGIKEEVFDLEHPANPDFGDYTTSIALKLAKKLKKNPLQIADSIIKNFSKDDLVKKIEVVKPGFINIWLSDGILLDQVHKAVKEGKEFGRSNLYHNKKIIIEYTDPNPFKEFHIGHLYSNIVGESLARLLETLQANVVRANYQGDVGMHVAKSLWGMKKKMAEENLTLEKLSEKPLEERIKFLGASYALGTKAFEGSEKNKEEITDLNKKIYEDDESVRSLYQTGRSWSLEYFETIYRRLDVNNGKGSFDKYYFESEVGKIGEKIVRGYLEKGVFQKSQGAIIFPGKKFGLHDRVFINSLGLPTYEAKELGLAFAKDRDFKYDLSVIVTGNEIIAYFKVLIAALSKINPELGKKTRHIAHGMVRLPEGKMSSRKGNVVTGEWLMNEAHKKAWQRIQETTKVKLDPSLEEKTAERVGIGAIKYALLKNGIGRDVEFDFDESINFEGNSGPYLQYTYVRTQSVLKNVPQIETFTVKEKNPEEESLLRLLYQYPEVIGKAAVNFSPNSIANYLFGLAQSYNLFYQKHPILKAQNDTRNFRLLLTKATGQVIKNGLYLLGIETVEKM